MDGRCPEQAVWILWFEAELKGALGSAEGIRALAQAAVRLAEPPTIVCEIVAALALCEALAGEHEWQTLLDTAENALRLIRAQRAMQFILPIPLAHIGTAQLELGNLNASRAAAELGIAFMRSSESAWSPHSYAVLARAQLALAEPAVDIAATLDEYATLLTRTGFHLYEGELHELCARLAAREGHHAEQTAALRRAHDCYTHFGMTAHLAGLQRDFGL